MTVTKVFLMSNFRGWILEALVLESALAVKATPKIQYLPSGFRSINSLSQFCNWFWPRLGSTNLFIHHRTFLEVLKMKKLEKSTNLIWLTHFSDFDEVDGLIQMQQNISRVFVQSTRLSNKLVEFGLAIEKITVIPGAVDRGVFFPLEKGQDPGNYFIFTGDCKPRKNPEIVEWIIRNFPEYNFVIHGRGWCKFNDGSLRKYQNLRILEFDYTNQGLLLREARALISVSQIEGGPISILEALASGTPVITTDTGFVADIIDSTNGIIVDFNLSKNSLHFARPAVAN